MTLKTGEVFIFLFCLCISFTTLFMPLFNGYEDSFFVLSATLTSILAVCFLIKTVKLRREYALGLFLGYKMLVIVFPFVYVVTFYDSTEIFFVSSFQEPGWKFRSIAVIITSLIVIFTCFLSYFIKPSKVSLVDSLPFRGTNLNFVFLILISLLAKIYLIKTGFWFAVVDDSIQRNVTAGTNFSKILSTLDVLVYFYFAKNFIRDRGAIFKYFLIASFLLSFVIAVMSSSKERILWVVIPAIFYLYNVNKGKGLSSKIKIAVVAISLILFVFDFVGHTRKELLSGSKIDISDFVYTYINKESDQDGKGLIYSMARRLDYNSVFSSGIRVYQEGDLILDKNLNSIFNNFWGLVPRVLWKDKPQLQNTNYLGRQVGIIPASDNVTSVGFTPIGEMFFEFGYFVLLVAPVCFIFALRLLDLFWKGRSELSLGLYLYFMVFYAKQDTLNLFVPSIISTFIYLGAAISLSTFISRLFYKVK